MKSKISQRLLRTIGALAIVAIFFFGTLFVLDFMDKPSRDAIRTENAKTIMAAVEKYRAAKGAYPVLPVPDSPITELAGPLVGGGYLRAIPTNPPGAEPTRYGSIDGKAFGLRIHLEQSGPCIVEVGASKTGWWGQPPACKL